MEAYKYINATVCATWMIRKANLAPGNETPK